MKVKAIYIRDPETQELTFFASARTNFRFQEIVDEIRSHNKECVLREFPCLSMVTDIIDEGVPA